MNSNMWKPIKNFEDLYLVNEKGDVYSIATDRILKHAVKRDGYHQVTLARNGKLTYCSVHRIVAHAFIQKVEGKNCINHKDGNKDNNCSDNLEWCTYQENVRHSIDVLGNHKIPVNQYTKDGTFIRTWDSILDAAKGTGAKAQHIWRNAQGIRKSTHGYVFQYAGNRRFA